MSAYAIAERFPIEARRYAASLKYTPQGANGIIPRGGLHADCALGACLWAIGQKDPFFRIPAAWVVAQGLGEGEVGKALDLTATGMVIQAEAAAFIVDFDNGRITDLADALGVAS